jgi:uncharacterized protein YfdQ (DUF2303 family)
VRRPFSFEAKQKIFASKAKKSPLLLVSLQTLEIKIEMKANEAKKAGKLQKSS